MQMAKNSQKPLKKKKIGALALLISRLVIVTKTVSYHYKNREIQSPERDSYAFGHLLSVKGGPAEKQRKDSIFNDGYPVRKKQNLTPTSHNNTKINSR